MSSLRSEEGAYSTSRVFPTQEIFATEKHATAETKSGSDDVENAVVTAPLVETAGYHRALGRRQIMMMTFGCGIGTGLWVGTGQALKYAGPGGIAIVYTVFAFIVYVQYCSVGEMTTYKPVHGGFIRQGAQYVDPAFGFALGINFWFAWVMIIPAEITAAVSVMKFWPASDVVPLAAYITIFLVTIAVSNVFHVRIYGYIEYCMSFAKCLAVIAVIMFLFIMTSGGIPATHGPIEFTYWKNPGAFTNGMKGISKAFVQAAFSFGGGEHIAVIAGEAADPRRTLKKTIRPVFWRMFTFFVLNIWLVGMCVPYNDDDLVNASGTLGSPFVIAMKRADAMWFAHLINGFIFLSVISCGVSAGYISSRSLAALADEGLLHSFFGRKDSQGRPWVALIISIGLGGGLTYLNCASVGVQVYSWFSALVTIATLFQLGCIYIAHLRFRTGLRAQGYDLKKLPFKGFGTPYAQYVALVVVLFVFGCEFYLSCWPFGEKGSAKTFFSSYLAAPLFFFDYFLYKFWFKTKIVKPEEMSFVEGLAFDEQDRLNEEELRNKAEVEVPHASWHKRVKYLIFG
ncbi:uncharacterized protein PV06_10549 [Exophiala oligosperma]|uniref:Amino acid permease/ SLC12A domain-containing protein n=1 Tax=Exophiala oligosperma TaxID=215243 RepID=A0A0D2DN56_9EURO|nr:uncharacterized protein PV06_10549 [Exophiala oligosperma]KIW37199.1 hypothetical protein PV06_10549 [Exophiala oligosperma]